MFKLDLNKIFEWFAERWHSKYTLVLASFLLIVVSITFFTEINISEVSFSEWSIIFILLFTLFILWLQTTKIPKNTKNKIGFIVSIATENKDQYKKLKADFLESIRAHLQKSSLRHQFNLIIYPEFFAKKLNDREVALNYLSKSKSHFLLYGRCRERNIEGKDQYIIDLQGAVTHTPISKQISKTFSKEFTELLPSRITLPHENDVFNFEIISNFINIVSKYIIGIASFFSGDYNYSKDLFLSVINDLKGIKTNLPAITTIRKRTPIRISDMLYLLGQNEYEKYKKHKNIDSLEKMALLAQESKKYVYNHYNASLLLAIYHFLKDRNIKAAIKELNNSKNLHDATWRYSYAFLKAYSGELDAAVRTYNNAFKHTCQESVPLQSEEFMLEILNDEPEKYQLYFCLGYLNFHIKKDFASAARDFELFINSDNTEEYRKQKDLAQKYLHEISQSFKT